MFGSDGGIGLPGSHPKMGWPGAIVSYGPPLQLFHAEVRDP